MSETGATTHDHEGHDDHGPHGPHGDHGDYEDHGEPGLYQIRVKGHLDDRRATWFEDLTLTRVDGGETLLTGPVVDQAALHGLLRKVRDLGLPLISVTRIRSGQVEADT